MEAFVPYVYRISVIYNESAKLWHVNLRWSSDLITQWGDFPFRWLAVNSAKRLAQQRVNAQGDNLRLEVHIHEKNFNSPAQIITYARDPRSRS